MSKNKKQEIINKNQLHKNDTGSNQVQDALLQTEIENLSRHLKKNMKDVVSRRILLKKVAKRKKITKQLNKV